MTAGVLRANLSHRRLSFIVAFCQIAWWANAQSRWQQGEFVLGTFWDPPFSLSLQDSAKVAANFRLAKDAFFNLLTGSQQPPAITRTFEGMTRALRFAHQAGLRYLITDERFYPVYEHDFTRAKGEEIVRDYRQLPPELRETMYGYNLCDEPHYSPEHVRRVAEWKSFFEGADPAKLAYVNLVGSYAPSYNWGGFRGGRGDGVPSASAIRQYEEYLRRYVDTLRPAVVSFDHYPFFNDGRIRRDYFYNLSVMKSRSAGMPMWAYPMTVDHMGYADPDSTQLLFMYFCPIAYGARGLIDFCFWAPSGREYRESLIDAYGQPTTKYFIVQRLNFYVTKFLGPQLLGARHVQVIHASNFPDGQLFIDQEIQPASPLVASVSDDRILVGVFQDSVGAVLLVVNKDRKSIRDVEIVLRDRLPRVSLGPRVVGFTGASTLRYSATRVWTKPGRNLSSFRIPELTGGEGVLCRVLVSQRGHR